MLDGAHLSVKELRKMTDEELIKMSIYPNLGCVGVNAQRVYREHKRRQAKSIRTS